MFTGFNIIESTEMVDRSVKVYKTTRKWKKHSVKRVYTSTPKPDVLKFGNTIIGHPVTIARLKKSLLEYSIMPVSAYGQVPRSG